MKLPASLAEGLAAEHAALLESGGVYIMDGMPAEGSGLPAIGAEIAGKYRIESVLGQGGMGAVFAARNTLTGKRVAIKWLLPEHAATSTQERLLREARIAASIDHPNVVDIYDVGEHQGGMFLVMEYLRGRPLSDLLAERGRLDPEELIALIVPAMRGVHAAHQAGVVHRDLKPENIFLSESDGQIIPKVLDFGVSKSVGASAVPVSSLTRTGALVGTPHYMALEQVDGSNAIDARTDVYAFGVLVYRALTGHFPFDGTSLGEVILKIGTKDPTPMRQLRPELPAGLESVVARALIRDRARRYADLEQMARALSAFDGSRPSYTSSYDMRSLTPGAVSFRALRLAGSDPAVMPVTPDSAVLPRAPLVPGKRLRALLVGAGGALALMAAGGLMLLRHQDAGMGSAPATSAVVAAPLAAPSRATGPALAASVPAEAPAAELPRGVAMIEPEVPAVPAVLVPEQRLGRTVEPVAAHGVGVLMQEPAAANDGPPEEPLAGAATGSSVALAAMPASAAPPKGDAAVSDPAGASRVWKATRSAKRAIKSSETPPVPSASVRPAPQLIPGERTNGLSVDEF